MTDETNTPATDALSPLMTGVNPIDPSSSILPGGADKAEKPAKAPAEPKAPAIKLEAILPDGTALKAIKYPMPLKATRYTLTVNGVACEAAQTTFGEIKYTYFIYEGASFYIPGHHAAETPLTFTHPVGYKFVPLKLDRAAQSAAAAKAKAAKAPAATPQNADAAPVQPGAAPETPTEGVSGENPEAALHDASASAPESAVEGANGKNSRRAKR